MVDSAAMTMQYLPRHALPYFTTLKLADCSMAFSLVKDFFQVVMVIGYLRLLVFSIVQWMDLQLTPPSFARSGRGLVRK